MSGRRNQRAGARTPSEWNKYVAANYQAVAAQGVARLDVLRVLAQNARAEGVIGRPSVGRPKSACAQEQRSRSAVDCEMYEGCTWRQPSTYTSKKGKTVNRAGFCTSSTVGKRK